MLIFPENYAFEDKKTLIDAIIDIHLMNLNTIISCYVNRVRYICYILLTDTE